MALRKNDNSDMMLKVTRPTGVFNTLGIADGSVGSPSLYFRSDTDTGLYRPGANILGVAVGGAEKLRVNSTGISTDGTILSGDGTAGAPAWSFASETDTGWRRRGAGDIEFYRDGVRALRFTDREIIFGPYDRGAKMGDGTNVHDIGGFGAIEYTYPVDVNNHPKAHFTSMNLLEVLEEGAELNLWRSQRTVLNSNHVAVPNNVQIGNIRFGAFGADNNWHSVVGMRAKTTENVGSAGRAGALMFTGHPLAGGLSGEMIPYLYIAPGGAIRVDPTLTLDSGSTTDTFLNSLSAHGLFSVANSNDFGVVLQRLSAANGSQAYLRFMGGTGGPGVASTWGNTTGWAAVIGERVNGSPLTSIMRHRVNAGDNLLDLMVLRGDNRSVMLEATQTRIKGPMGSATHTDRLLFQSSVTNESTVVGAMPNGTSTTAGFTAYNGTNPDAASLATVSISNTQMTVGTTVTGAGSALPVHLSVSGVGDMVQLRTNKDVVLGFESPATDATAGWVWIPNVGGTPTGTPSGSYSGRSPLVVDSAANKLWCRVGGGWKSVTFA